MHSYIIIDYPSSGVKLQKDGNGRYHITVPKSVVECFGWNKGDEIDFEILGKEELKILPCNK